MAILESLGVLSFNEEGELFRLQLPWRDISRQGEILPSDVMGIILSYYYLLEFTISSQFPHINN